MQKCDAVRCPKCMSSNIESELIETVELIEKDIERGWPQRGTPKRREVEIWFACFRVWCLDCGHEWEDGGSVTKEGEWVDDWK